MQSTPILGFDYGASAPGVTGGYTLWLTNAYLLGGDWARGPAGTNETTFWLNAFQLPYVTPLLATSWELPDPNTFIYKIRHGVHFQNKPPVNGREVNADDLVWVLQRAINSPFQNHDYHKDIESITKIDKYTVQLKLNNVRFDSPKGIIGTFQEKLGFRILSPHRE
jgi:ABC-type transport system substrate-binding protein